MGAPRPYTLVAELTYKCPLKCLYCSNPVNFHEMQDELSTEQWCKAISEAADLGVVQLHFTGGEPVVRKDLPDLIRHARSRDLYTNLITGGTMLTEQKLRQFRDCGLDHIQLSVQDTDRRTAELIAGIRSYDKKLEIARLIKRMGFPLTLNVCLHRLNIDHVPELILQAAELGAQRLELANTAYYGWAFENRSALMPTRAQFDALEPLVKEARARYQGTMEIISTKVDYYSEYPKPCMGGWANTYMVIIPTGEVLPCHAAHMIPGLHFDSVRDQSLIIIWEQSQGLNAFRGDGWMQEPCRSCPMKATDFGGCRCQAYLLTKDAAATDPVCSLSPRHDIIREAILDAERGDGHLIYRDARNSERLSVHLREPVAR
jgi:pyrroloquinoline quinone biosynthesis protein E